MGSWRVGQDWGNFTFTFKDVLKQLFLIIVLKVLAPLCIHRQEWTPEVELGKQIQQALQTWESRNQSYPAGQKLGGTSVWISHPRIMFFLPSTIISLFLSGHIWYLEGKCWRTTENTLARLWGAAVFRGGDENWYFQSWTLSLSMTFFRFHFCVGFTAAIDCFEVEVWVCVCVKLLQLCLTLCDPVDCSLPRSSVHRLSQARILEWVAMPISRRSSPTHGSSPPLLRLLHW